MDINIVEFDEVIFDFTNKVMTIVNGSIGEYGFSQIKSSNIEYEKAKYHGKKEPFYVTVRPTRLPLGMLSETSFYVGLKVVLKNEKVLAIYVSKKKTRNNTDQHIKDTKKAKQIQKILNKIIEENKSPA